MSLPLQPEFADIDRHFANFIGRFGGDDTLVPLAAALLSRSIREGNICLPLDRAPSDPAEASGALRVARGVKVAGYPGELKSRRWARR